VPDHPRIAEERIRQLGTHDIALADFAGDGYILDIGGGGEGIIGQLKYGQFWAEKAQDLPYYAELARAAAFEIVEQDAQAQHFYLRLRKAVATEG
jgi:hypothetical protein